MSSHNRPLRIELTVNPSHPRLLEGLDTWVRLSLLSDAQVKRLSQQYLTCRLPQPEITPTPPIPQVTPPREVETPLPLPSPSLLSQMWQSFQDELSVRWLLFLGVFLVVVSSGVLAATQWQNFPPAGQYGVLWGYTVIFWGISVWAGKQPSLQLTAQTLQLISLLLVPVNFWAIDGFGLWRHPWEWMVVGVAAFTLTAITLLNQAIRDDSPRLTSRASLILWLSYLHWGWQWSGFALIAVYLGVIGTAILLPKRRNDAENVPQSSRFLLTHAPTGSSVIIYALTVLLVRGIFVVGLPIEPLGLAIGICGWLLARLGKPPETPPESASSFGSQLWDAMGGGLLFIGWLVSVGEVLPWQATAVSGLGLLFFGQRLQYSGRRRDLAALFVIGLQALVLLWRLVPAQFQQSAIAFFTQLLGSPPEALLSLAFFPYIIVWVGITDWLYRQSKTKLTNFGERLTFGLGLVLTLIGMLNPTVRSLNLLLSTITLAIVTHRRTPIRVPLVYLTHITGLLTLSSIINEWFPTLSKPAWATLLLILMVGEWSLSTLQPASLAPSNTPRRSSTTNPRPSPFPTWYRSCWHMGFALAGVSYALLWNQTFPLSFSQTPQQWQLLWLLTPLTLTGVASYTPQPRRLQASWWSVAALVIAQFLTLPLAGLRLVSLGFASGLMLINTRYLRQQVAAAITIGFALSFIAASLGDGILGLPPLSVGDWFLAGAIAILGLWLLYSLFNQRPGTLAALYAQASDQWAVVLCSLELSLLTLHSIASYLQLLTISWHYLTASILIGTAILYRTWQQPTNIRVYGISWVIELTLAQTILLANGSLLTLASANIILALLTLFLTDWWLTQQSPPSVTSVTQSVATRFPILSSLEVLPLLYALLGISLRWNYFTSYTGFLTLGAALTGLGVGRRRSEWKGISYLSIVGISLAWYELVIYPMLQAPQGNPADGFTVLAVVATVIAIAYRLLAWFWQSQSRATLLNFSITEIEITAHLHWAIGSSLMVLSAGMSLGTTPNLRPVGLAVSSVLAGYALLQGRYWGQGDKETRENLSSPDSGLRTQDSGLPTSPSDFWIYAGLTEVAATGVYARLTWTQLSIFDPWRVIIACAIAFFLYQLPWRRWGWNPIPWQRYALVSPLLTVWLNLRIISSMSLLGVAGFYAWVAKRQSNVRWTYVSVFFIDWAIVRWLERQQLTDPLWYATLVGLSLLYIAEVDRGLRMPHGRQTRHYLRLVGSGLICLVAVVFHQDTGLIPGIIGILAIFAGLGLRVRAFLFIGTATFLGTAFYQLVVLSFRYPFSKWVIGLIAGILLISIAANFERRRDQIIAVLQNWIREFQEWA